MKSKLEEKFSEELVAANLKRVADWRGKFCLKASNQKLRKGDSAGKPLKLVTSNLHIGDFDKKLVTSKIA